MMNLLFALTIGTAVASVILMVVNILSRQDGDNASEKKVQKHNKL